MHSMHTFLFQPGVWLGKGEYIAANGSSMPATGRTQITHKPEVWIMEGWMERGEGGARRENHYEIKPWRPGMESTTWTARNPEIGEMYGRLVVMRDMITAMFRSADDRYSGMEVLLMHDETTYGSSGVFYQDEKVLGKWIMTLTREIPGVSP